MQFLRRTSSCSPNCDTSDIRCVVIENTQLQNIAIFCRFLLRYDELRSHQKPELGGESLHKIAFFMHRSICDAANIQLRKIPQYVV